MILYRHIIKAHFAPFVGSFSILMFLFMLQFIMKFMDQLAGKGLTGAVIIELMILNLAWMVVLAVPMAVLVATLMAFGALSAQSEITAMKAGGMSLYKMMAPVVLLSFVITYLMIEFNNQVLPEANHRLKTLLTDIHRKKPTFSLIPGLFSQDIPGYSILVRKTFAESNNLEGITIFDYTNPAKHVAITARRGTLSFSADYRKLIMDLEDGEIHELNTQNYREYRHIRYDHQRLATRSEGFDFERSGSNAFSRGDRELSAGIMMYIVDSLSLLIKDNRKRIELMGSALTERILTGSSAGAQHPLWTSIDQYQTISSQMMVFRNYLESETAQLNYFERTAREYLVEIHKKFSIPVACMVFVLIGAPLGVMARKGGFGVAASLSLGFFLLYWASLIGGEKLADRELIDPWFGMWIANIIIGLLGIALTMRIARENVELRFDGWKRFLPKRFRFAEEKIAS